ncbi:hypothetical protein BGZ89_005921 [Linnemannia elongata]|nr:hypothetical protein BGZ89_005921 [Linnemannia elongata]
MGPSSLLVASVVSTFALWSNLCLHTHAAQPDPVGGAAYALVGTNFYIHGGAKSSLTRVEKLWALDLTKAWTISEPAWTQLPVGPFNSYHSAGYSADNKTFITFGRDTGIDPPLIPTSFVNTYDIKTAQWTTNINTPQVADPSRRDFSVVTNPGVNKNYILGGGSGVEGATYNNKFTTYDPTMQSATEINTPVSGPQNIATYAAVWITRIRAMMVIGGNYQGGQKPTGLFLYSPDTNTWITKNTTGTFSYSRIAHCAASNADGSIVVVAGGWADGIGTKADPTLYILNTVTWQWSNYSYPIAVNATGSATCAIIENTFLVWGGFFTNPPVPFSVPSNDNALLLFSLSTKQWTKSYTPSAALSGGGTVPPSNNSTGGGNTLDPTSSGGLSTGAIVGISAGVVALAILAIFGVAWNRRRKRLGVSVPKGKASAGNDGNNNNSHSRPDKTEHDRQVAQPSPSPSKPTSPNPPSGQYQSLANVPNEAVYDAQPNLEGVAYNSYSNNNMGSSGYSTEGNTPTRPEFGGLRYSITSEAALQEAMLAAGDENNRPSYIIDGSVFHPPPPLHFQHQPTILEDSPYQPSALSTNYTASPGDRRYNYPQSVVDPSSPDYNYQNYVAAGGRPVWTPAVPYVPAPDSQYHDGGGYVNSSVANSSPYQSGISAQTDYTLWSPQNSAAHPMVYDPRQSVASPSMSKRVSSPQGGVGFGFVVDQPTRGAPQALLDYQASLRKQQQSPPSPTVAPEPSLQQG